MVEGETVKASAGTWTGSPTSFAYEWQDCSSSGASCAPIAGASGVELQAHLLGRRSDAPGSGHGHERGRFDRRRVGPHRPRRSITAAGTRQPDAARRRRLASKARRWKPSTGTWTENPSSYAYQWQDCNSLGLLHLHLRRDGLQLRPDRGGCRAHDQGPGQGDRAGGSNSATSPQTGVVQVLAPVNSVFPAVSGSAVEGQSLKASNGTWSGSPTSFSYQWQDCNSLGASCVAISGAVNSSYTLAGSNAGSHGQGAGERSQ